MLSSCKKSQYKFGMARNSGRNQYRPGGAPISAGELINRRTASSFFCSDLASMGYFSMSSVARIVLTVTTQSARGVVAFAWVVR